MRVEFMRTGLLVYLLNEKQLRHDRDGALRDATPASRRVLEPLLAACRKMASRGQLI
ncbi:hypothetical protein [Paludibacterium paludis]|uniref:Uncharacterized protein n=1 Tax=Paludibacterium paludis TaxID=1225769 RepID=A0A918P4Y3_9NEIS|nr:hypothetical protein [Paludibacterium paludis]GGY23286.1 hypothetical protein GCM10011289_28840 [Paludibacterium paludis]